MASNKHPKHPVRLLIELVVLTAIVALAIIFWPRQLSPAQQAVCDQQYQQVKALTETAGAIDVKTSKECNAYIEQKLHK